MRVAALVLVAACSGSGKKEEAPAPKQAGICKRAELDKALASMADVPADMRQTFGAAVTAEACTLPQPITDALADISSGGDCIGAAKGVAEAPALFLRACPAGHDTVRVVSELPPPEGMAELAKRCELARLGFATQEELAGARHWACMLLGSMVFVALDEAGEPKARDVARLIAL
jgi:hypothetical protein